MRSLAASDYPEVCRDKMTNHHPEGSYVRCDRGAAGGASIEDSAVAKLQLLQQQLSRGNIPPIVELQKTMNLISEALSSQETAKSEEERLECVRDRQVREWLSTTFTHSDSLYKGHEIARTPIVKFKAAANTIIISQYLGNIYKDLPLPSKVSFSKAVTQYLQLIDDWNFDMFQMESLCDGVPFRYVAHYLIKTHNLFEICEISVEKFDSFLVRIEEGYNRHGNPYHNACHGADVAQTIHYMLHASGVECLMNRLEVLSVLLAALIHDVDHPGTTNNFQINQHSEYALMYNDRSVLENHHLHFTFALLQESDCNFLESLCVDDFKLLRGLVIEMVLATDMSSHFDRLKHMRHVLSLPEACSQLLGTERAKMFSLLLHIADISHPGKPWVLHKEWSWRLANEFYRQGDEERHQGFPISPLCDRNTSNLPTSQLGFIEFIVSPSFLLCGDMLDVALSSPKVREACATPMLRVWEPCLADNKRHWEEESTLAGNTTHHIPLGELPHQSKEQITRKCGHVNGIHSPPPHTGSPHSHTGSKTIPSPLPP